MVGLSVLYRLIVKLTHLICTGVTSGGTDLWKTITSRTEGARCLSRASYRSELFSLRKLALLGVSKNALVWHGNWRLKTKMSSTRHPWQQPLIQVNSLSNIPSWLLSDSWQYQVWVRMPLSFFLSFLNFKLSSRIVSSLFVGINRSTYTSL